MARSPSRPSTAIVRTVVPGRALRVGEIREVVRILRDADDGLVDFEEVHADAVARVRRRARRRPDRRHPHRGIAPSAESVKTTSPIGPEGW